MIDGFFTSPFFIENRFFSHIMYPATPSRSHPPPLPSTSTPLLSLIIKLILRYKRKQKLTHQSWTRPTGERGPKRRNENGRPTHAHTQEFPKALSWQLYIYTEDLLVSDFMNALLMLIQMPLFSCKCYFSHFSFSLFIATEYLKSNIYITYCLGLYVLM